MQKLALTTIALSILLIATGCTPGNQTVQQVQACAAGNPHPWCMQMAQTKPLGAAPYGLESNAPTNPEMQEDTTPYPRNPALPLQTPGHGPLLIGGMR
ncbi:MAG: hypothetical protein WCA22_10180 [Candidatus Binatus sp.]